eukprot:6541670-Prorocentrum_lima.AAC.1
MDQCSWSSGNQNTRKNGGWKGYQYSSYQKGESDWSLSTSREYVGAWSGYKARDTSTSEGHTT